MRVVRLKFRIAVSPVKVGMKTIILCGGQGTRLREETEFRPKPMVNIGGLPILLHIMNIYAAHGFKDFVLCLGYKGHVIREYFLNLANLTNDLELNLANGQIRYLNNIAARNYIVSFVDTGLNTASGERVIRAATYVPDEQFMVTYGDGVGNVDLTRLVAYHQRQTRRHNTIATITGTHPSSKYGQVASDERNVLTRFDEKPTLGEYINGGFMVFNHDALNYLRAGETLEQGLQRMTSALKLSMYRHEGFWHGMDTMKDVQHLNQIWEDQKPWVIQDQSPIRISVQS